MLEKLVFETKTFESALGADRSLIFKVIDLGGISSMAKKLQSKSYKCWFKLLCYICTSI